MTVLWGTVNVTDDDVRKHIQTLPSALAQPLRQAAEIDLGLSDECSEDGDVARLL